MSDESKQGVSSVPGGTKMREGVVPEPQEALVGSAKIGVGADAGLGNLPECGQVRRGW